MGGFGSVSLLSATAIVLLLFAKISIASGLNQSVILVSFDGLGWEFVGSKRTNTPHFDFFARGGVKAKNLVGVHPVKTFPVHTTFMTGLYPESHGIVDNKFWDPVYMEKFILEHDCSNFDAKFYNESEPIWLTMQKQGRRAGAYYWPGSTSYSEKPTFYAEPFCYLKCEDYKGPILEYLRLYLKIHCFFNWAKPFRERIDTVLEWLVSENPPQLVMLYFEQPDMAGHENGPNASLYKDKIEAMDREVLGYLVERLMTLQLMDKTNVILLSDHGMIETKDSRQIRIHDYIDPDSYFKNIAAREHIWPKPGKLQEIYEKLKTADNPHLKVYKKEEIPDEFHWKNNRRIPPIYLVADEGWLMRHDFNPLAEGEWIEGTHGWPPTENSAGIFYARGPAFKEGYASNSSKTAIDVYALLCYLVGVKPLPNNGSMDNMVEFLKKSPASNHERTTTSYPLFTPTITTSRLSPQTKTVVDNQWYNKENQTRNDSIYSHTDTTTETTTASSIPPDQRKTDKEKQERSGSFVLQTPDQHQTEVNGNNLDHKSENSPQHSVKVTPTITKITNQMHQTPSVSPQTSSISALGILMSTAGNLDSNVQLTQDNQKEKETISSQHKILTSKMFRTSDLTQTDLILTTRSLLDSKPAASTRMTLTVLTDSKIHKSTPILLDTPVFTSDLQPFITASTLTTLTESYSPSPTVVDTLVNTDQHNVTISTVLQPSLAPVDSPILSSDVKQSPLSTLGDFPKHTDAETFNLSKNFQKTPLPIMPSLTPVQDSPILSDDVNRSPLSTVGDIPKNTDAQPFVLSKNFQTTPLPVRTPLLTSDAATTSTKTSQLKPTSTKTNDLQVTLLDAPFLSTSAASVVSTATSTKLTDINLRTTLIPVVTNRVNSKEMSDGKELRLGTTALKSFISADKLTQHYEGAKVSVDAVEHPNTTTITPVQTTTKELLSETTDIQEVQDFVEGNITSSSLLQKQTRSSSAVPATETPHTTENTLKSSVLIVSPVQVNSSSVPSSSAFNTTNITSNFTRNNMSIAFNSSNETKSVGPDEGGVNVEALIDCPPYEEEEEEENEEFIGNTNAHSSTTAITKPFTYLEAVMMLMIVKLNAWLCTQ